MNRRLPTSWLVGFAGRGCRLPDSYVDKESLAPSQCGPFSVNNLCFGPVFAALAADYAALQANGRAGGNRAAVVDLDVAGHGSKTQCADGLAHDFVEQCGDDAAVQIAGVAFECIRNRHKADDRSVLGEKEFELQTAGVCRAAAEAAVAGDVGHGGEVISGFRHCFA
jgi:hypothetical protein